jgi:hypothetical protein
MAASNAQVQQYVNQRMRVRCEQIRNLKFAMEDDLAVIVDVYANLTNSPTWTDDRPDGPPHLLAPNDVLAYNTFLTAMAAFFDPNGDTTTIAAGADQWPVVQSACVRPVEF